MSDKVLKKFMIFIIILILIIFIAIIILTSHISKLNEDNTNTQEGGGNVVEAYGKSANGGVDVQAYFDINYCMQEYLNATNIKSTQYLYYNVDDKEIENKIKQKIYNLLSQKYIDENNIVIENIYNHIKLLEEQPKFVLLEASLIQDNENIKSFLIQGLVESNENYNVIDEIFAIVNINISEVKFSIEPIYGNYNSIDEIKIEQFEENIKSNADNKFYMTYFKAEDIPAEYINLYKRLALGYPEKMYNLLDKEYRESKFGNLEGFKKYIEENKSEIRKIRLEKYQFNIDENNSIQYICIDKDGKYYIFEQNVILQDFELILDTYTVDLPEFIEKYNNSSEEEKVLLNIQKVIDATKDEDYKYVFSKLDEEFKSNNFKTEAEFEKFIKEKYDSEDTISYTKFEKTRDVYIYNINITDKNTNQITNAKIVMQLKEGTDFVMSFSAE